MGFNSGFKGLNGYIANPHSGYSIHTILTV